MAPNGMIARQAEAEIERHTLSTAERNRHVDQMMSSGPPAGRPLFDFGMAWFALVGLLNVALQVGAVVYSDAALAGNAAKDPLDQQLIGIAGSAVIPALGFGYMVWRSRGRWTLGALFQITTLLGVVFAACASRKMLVVVYPCVALIVLIYISFWTRRMARLDREQFRIAREGAIAELCDQQRSPRGDD